MATVEMRNLSKTFDGGVKAVDNVNINVNDKEFVVLVGPSGCGKTTTLRMVAGLEDITSGELYIDGKLMNDVPPKDRDIAMVFQNYALYPHMSVYDNMAFGLKIRRFPKAEIESRVREAAKILDIEGLLDRKPKALSGGQRQRVAVGRAIVRHPKVFLFDEPLSNLDAKLRVQMRAEISALHNRLNATMIYVTHDQVEAMTMADKIVVMKGGLIQQIGNPLKLYNNPVNRFVAGFIGSPPMNFLAVTILEKNGSVFMNEGDFEIEIPARYKEKLKAFSGKEITFGIRPEDLLFVEKEIPGTTIPTEVSVIEPLGAEIHLYVNTKKHSIIAKVSPEHQLKIGDKICFRPNMDKIKFFDLETERSLFFEDQ
ncbi:MAG: sn-glycerol-3-phosphate ABC transporter ATP-binding protein UgpC [Spirochaetales bacterium]|nr:MAG: sn-glycerol-3-phosphate ABC transporter ATP-binding protein UgpC [Spirochaetales bacterium]